MYFLDLDGGHIMTFCGGSLLHAGDPVLTGTRYILAGFVFIRNKAVIPHMSLVDAITQPTDTDTLGACFKGLKRKRKDSDVETEPGVNIHTEHGCVAPMTASSGFSFGFNQFQ